VSAKADFYFDLGSPYAYLAAERVNGLFAEAEIDPPEWRPVLLGGLLKRFDHESWASGPDRDLRLREIEQRASSYQLQPVRWPTPFPGDMLFAMRTATYAKQIGRTVAFSLAAFRQAFAAGRDLSEPDNVLLAAAACELHPRAIVSAAKSRATKAALRDATERAGDIGVRAVPSLVVGSEVFWGDDRLEAAVFAAGQQS